MTRRTRIGAAILFHACQLVGLLPFRVLYGPVRWFFCLLIYRVARYRIGVVRANLRNSFPEKAPGELRAIEKKFYLHLAEVFIDIVDMASISRREIIERLNFASVREHEKAMEGRDWIAAMAHLGSWEYYTAYQCLTAAQTAGIYHPLGNAVFDLFFRRIRERFGMEAVPMASIVRYIARRKAEKGPRRNIAVGMIADQTPPWPDIHRWFDFMHQKTAFFEGVERLAVRFSMPVYFVHLRKIRAAHYETWVEEIYDGVSEVEPYEITSRYAARLEAAIRQQPEVWMWSHRRWKRNPSNPRNKVFDGL